MPDFRFNTDTLTLLARHLFVLKQNSHVTPKRLFVYPTGLCDDKCRYCVDGLNAGDAAFLRYDPEKDFFNSQAYIDKLISDIKELQIIDMHIFGGGEPFFYKENMFYFLEKLKDLDIFIRIITNANRLNDEDIEKIIKNKLVSQLNISFNTDSDASAAKIYKNTIRHTHTLNILSSITKYKNIYKTDFPKVHIMFVILNINYNKVIEIVELLNEHTIEFFMFQPLRVSADGQRELALSLAQEEQLIMDIPHIEEALQRHNMRSNINSLKPTSGISADRDAAENRPLTNGMTPELSNAKSINTKFYKPDFCSFELINKYGLRIKCHMPLTTMAICYNGNIPFCQFKYNEQYRANYFDIASLKDFTESQEYRTFVGNFINGEFPEMCRGCSFCIPQETETIKNIFNGFFRKKDGDL